MRELDKKLSVTVGVHAEEGAQAAETKVEAVHETKSGKEIVRHLKVGAEGVTVIDKAAGAEYGIGQPIRSWCGGWVDENADTADNRLKAVLMPVVQGKHTLEQAAARYGLWVAGQMKQRIADGIMPELSIERQIEKQIATGNEKNTPLIFTGQFRSSIRSKVDVG
jgi:hypothetical protein